MAHAIRDGPRTDEFEVIDMRDGIEAGTGETEGLDAKRESPVTRSGTRPNPWFTTPNPILEGVELREAYARIIDPMAWKVYDKQIEYAGEKPADPLADPQRYDAWHYRTGLADQAVAPSLAKADAILALPNPTAYARIREALEAGLKSEAIAIGFQWTAISPKGLAGALDFLAGRASEALKTTPLIGLSQGEGERLADLIRDRDGENFDGEIHLTSAEGEAIVAALSTVQDGSVREEGPWSNDDENALHARAAALLDTAGDEMLRIEPNASVWVTRNSALRAIIHLIKPARRSAPQSGDKI